MKKTIHSVKAPAPIGPYSQAVKAGDFLFVSGQIALDAATGELMTESVEGETELVMQNLKAILEEADTDFMSVVKATIFLKNMDDFPRVNKVYERFFESDPPARETVQVAGLPKNVNVEISVIAYIKE